MKKTLILILVLYSVLANAIPKESSRKTVNAITFWGYLDDPLMTKAIEKKCHVKFSHDVYYTNAQFIDTFNKRSQDFDIVIASNMAYGSIKDKIPKFDSDLYRHVNDYYPYFKDYYYKQDYNKNTVFFAFALMGFLYNPGVINISLSDPMSQIFKNAKNNLVILTDDSGEVGNLITINQQYIDPKNRAVAKLNYENLKSLTQDTKVFISGDFNKLYDRSDFAFSYLWSGDALMFIKKYNKSYKFVLPITSTSICLDVLIQMKNTPEAKCVAEALQDKSVLEYLQKDTFYFTPYFENNINDRLYQQLYKQTKTNINYYKIIPPVNGFNEYYNDGWQSVKMKIDEKH